jgi:hypothetical protein
LGWLIPKTPTVQLSRSRALATAREQPPQLPPVPLETPHLKSAPELNLRVPEFVWRTR